MTFLLLTEKNPFYPLHACMTNSSSTYNFPYTPTIDDIDYILYEHTEKKETI